MKYTDPATLVTPHMDGHVITRESETAPSIEEIVRRIQILESSGGKNNYSKCEAIGKYNRYGFGIPGNGTYMCFEKDDDTKAVRQWFEDMIKTKNRSLGEAVCGYNLGFESEHLNECLTLSDKYPYLKDFMSK